MRRFFLWLFTLFTTTVLAAMAVFVAYLFRVELVVYLGVMPAPGIYLVDNSDGQTVLFPVKEDGTLGPKSKYARLIEDDDEILLTAGSYITVFHDEIRDRLSVDQYPSLSEARIIWKEWWRAKNDRLARGYRY